MKQKAAVASMKDYLHDYKWEDYVEAPDRVGLFVNQLGETVQRNPNCAEEIDMLKQWIKSNPEKAKNTIELWMREEQEDTWEEDSDDNWREEIARNLTSHDDTATYDSGYNSYASRTYDDIWEGDAEDEEEEDSWDMYF